MPDYTAPPQNARHKGGRTTLVTAHRMSTLRRADLVVVLDRGRIVQFGTHEQLMREQGHYCEAARLQIVEDELPETAAASGAAA